MSKGMIVAIILGFGILVKIFSSLKQIFKVAKCKCNLATR